MKVLQINKYHYIRGGADSVYFNTSELLRQHGHEVIHFSMDFKENEPSPQTPFFATNNDFTQLNTLNKIKNVHSFFYNKNAATNIERLIKNNRPDIAHLHIFYGSLTSSVLEVLKKHHIPTVVSVHDYKFICSSYLMLNAQNEVCEKCKGKNHFHAISQGCVKNNRLYSTLFAAESYYRDLFFPLEKMFDGLIFVSKFSQEKHIEFRPELAPISHHIYNFDPALSEKKASHTKGGYFLYAGRLSKEKGLHTLVKAFNELPNIQLQIAGTGPEENELRQIANDNISFLGFQKRDSLQEIIKNSSFIIVPSEWYENNPMAIIEAYSLGKPVIGATIGGIPEIIENEKTGLLFKSGDINQLCNAVIKAHETTKTEYENYVDNCLSFANNHFHPEKHYQQLINFYEKTIREHDKNDV